MSLVKKMEQEVPLPAESIHTRMNLIKKRGHLKSKKERHHEQSEVISSLENESFKGIACLAVRQASLSSQ